MPLASKNPDPPKEAKLRAASEVYSSLLYAGAIMVFVVVILFELLKLPYPHDPVVFFGIFSVFLFILTAVIVKLRQHLLPKLG